MERQDLAERTKQFSLRIIRLAESLPNTWVIRILGGQVLRCGTSVGAQYREARRARSTAEYISKIESGLQELDEATYWLDLLVESGKVPGARLGSSRKEADELCAILVSCVKTAKRSRKNAKG